VSAVASDTLEQRYLNGTFAELCRIGSPSGSERRCAERVIAELRPLGLEVLADDAGPRAGSDCGNLLVRIPAAGGQAAPSLLLCAHLDTVPLQAPVEPVLVDGYWENANDGVLGADNKAAVAVLLALARHVHREGAPVDVELLFTVCEETALAGARAFDASRLRSHFGFVFDHASPIGELVVESPTHLRVEAAFRGAAAHAGLRPEQGRSAILAAARAVCAMPHGRVDAHSTVNVATISGGSAINVVPEHCSLLAEVRSLDGPRAEALAGELVDRAHEAANLPECECDVDIGVQRTFAGYRLPAGAPVVQVADSALRACGHEPVRISSGGASDANALVAQGLPVVNLANGTERNHEPGERVSVLALEQALDVALALLDAAALSLPQAR
jgi:tripeptide aminopeptidase